MSSDGGINPAESTELYRRSSTGDEAALHALLIRESEWLRKQVKVRIPDLVRREADTGDVVQEVAMRILRTATPIRFQSQQQFRSYLCTVVCNALNSIASRFLTEKRDAGRERRACGDDDIYGADRPVDSVTRPDDRAARDETVQLVETATDLMPGPMQDLVNLRVRDDLSFAEIGRMLDISDQGAKKRFNTALRTLRATMEALHADALHSLLD